MESTGAIIRRAKEAGLAVPAFNVPYLPMVKPVIQAVVDQDAFALIEVARLEWIKFESRSLEAVYDEFIKWADMDYVRLHLDHIPAIDEDNLKVDYMPIFRQAIQCGYHSVMVDGSRLALEENIKVTRQVAELAHQAGIPCEAELGAVLGHEEGPLPPYEELFSSGKGFTDIKEAETFVRETNCDWLSVAVGNIHGQISMAFRDQKKLEARLDLGHLKLLADVTGIPLVLHGGSGVRRKDMLQAIKSGIIKVNIGTEIRQAYETTFRATGSCVQSQETVYKRTCSILRDTFGLNGTRSSIL